jgi:hypothetical protein
MSYRYACSLFRITSKDTLNWTVEINSGSVNSAHAWQFKGESPCVLARMSDLGAAFLHDRPEVPLHGCTLVDVRHQWGHQRFSREHPCERVDQDPFQGVDEGKSITRTTEF